MRNGMVVLVGAGPGDPGLITVKGLSCLKACDAVVYDSLSSEQLLAAARRTAGRYMWASGPDGTP